MSATIRRRRPPYVPAWGDEKHGQAIRSAWRGWFGEDPSQETLNALLREIGHRQRRTGSPKRPGQPWPDADLKVWRRWARERGHAELLTHLDAVDKARQGPGTSSP